MTTGERDPMDIIKQYHRISKRTSLGGIVTFDRLQKARELVSRCILCDDRTVTALLMGELSTLMYMYGWRYEAEDLRKRAIETLQRLDSSGGQF